MVYFNEQQFIPYHRLSQVCEDLYGQPLSEATVADANQQTYDHLAPFEQRVVTLLPQAPVNGCDESGLRVAKTLHWLHVVSNPALTFYGVHPKRGTEAMDDFGIDCPAWRKDHGVLDEPQFKKVHARYRAILRMGRRRHPRRAGRAAQSKAANLLDRLEDFDLNVLALTIFEEVPFTNSGSERDLRMEKTRQKVSGCFRTLDGARVFVRIRSYISTSRKQGQNILDALEKAIVGNPFMPSAPAKGP
jgi:transposase